MEKSSENFKRIIRKVSHIYYTRLYQVDTHFLERLGCHFELEKRNIFGTVVLQHESALKSLGALFNIDACSPPPVPGSIGLGWGLRTCLPTNFPGGAADDDHILKTFSLEVKPSSSLSNH